MEQRPPLGPGGGLPPPGWAVALFAVASLGGGIAAAVLLGNGPF